MRPTSGQMRRTSSPDGPRMVPGLLRAAVPDGCFHARDDGPVCVGSHPVPAGVKGEFRGGVTEPRGHRLDVHPGPQPEGGGCVP